CQALNTVETLSVSWGFLRLYDMRYIRPSLWFQTLNAYRDLFLLTIPLSLAPSPSAISSFRLIPWRAVPTVARGYVVPDTLHPKITLIHGRFIK
ncbi:hypothetical protein, partial [Photorhabdus aegyptia]|uniref:hypothetical protein n=1 Tax=Photorhabdus aegyptia TaxID=2805098 RepID=UPI001F410668